MKPLRRTLAIFGGAVALIALAGAGWIYALGTPPLGKDLEISHVVLDREGKVLRAYATSEGRWRLPATEKDVDPRFLRLLFAYEDKRFRTHHGVDPVAMARAAVQFASSGHIVSGGSTLTMQVARLLEPRQQRSLLAKLRQSTRALELEGALSKDEILSLYLTLAPYGGNLEGIRAASLSYFGKEPRRLTLGEAALLVASAAVTRVPASRSLSGGGASRARPRARSRGNCRHSTARRDCPRQVGNRAACAPAIADARPAFIRSDRCRRARPAHSPPHHRCRLAEDVAGTRARARACARAGHFGGHSGRRQ